MAQLNAWLSKERLAPVERFRCKHPVSRSTMAKALIAIGARTSEADPQQLEAELLRVAEENNSTALR